MRGVHLAILLTFVLAFTVQGAPPPGELFGHLPAPRAASSDATARLYGERETRIVADGDGRIVDIRLRLGDHFTQDEVLAVLEGDSGETIFIRAPWSGVLAQRSVRDGQKVRAGDPLFSLTDDRTLVASFNLPLGTARNLQPGSGVRLEVANATIVFHGQVQDVWSAGDVARVTVEAALPPEDARPGATVRLITPFL